jgi:hypothetical protein
VHAFTYPPKSFIALFVERSGCKRNRLKRRVDAPANRGAAPIIGRMPLGPILAGIPQMAEYGADGSGFRGFPEDPNPLKADGACNLSPERHSRNCPRWKLSCPRGARANLTAFECADWPLVLM